MILVIFWQCLKSIFVYVLPAKKKKVRVGVKIRILALLHSELTDVNQNHHRNLGDEVQSSLG